MSADPTDPQVDRFDGVPDYAPLRAAIAAGDWAGFAAAMADWPAEEVTHALHLLSENDDDAPREFLVEHREHPLARVALAYRFITLAWRTRTHAPASEVGPAQWVAFRQHLAEAEQLLIEACAEDPTLGPAWTARVLTARGLGLPEAEARRRFQRSRAAGDDVWAHVHLHQYLEPKWYGSVEAARAHVDECLDGAADGSLAGVLVPLFHLERWYEKGGAHLGYAHLRESRVLDELDAAARRSVLHASRRTLTPATAAGHQIFLSVWWLAGEKAKAAAHRSRLGRRTTAHWELLAADDAGRRAAWRELERIGRGDA